MGQPTLIFKMAMLKARTEFASALNQVCSERGIDPEIVVETIKEAVLAAYKRDFNFEEGYEYGAEIDPETGATHLFSWPEEHQDKKKEVTPPGFGRIAAQVAKQVLLQKIREAEKSAMISEYRQRVDSLTNGMVLRFEGPNIVIDVNKAEAVMPPVEQVRSENYQLNQRMTFYIKAIDDLGKGEQVVVSRADERLVERLFRREVPEVAAGSVEIRKMAREPGGRTKIAVVSTQTGVDPVGSCVGQKGVRVQAVIDELDGEKIDIIQYSDYPDKFIVAALSPADGIKVKIDEEQKLATVTAPENQLSLAIGKDGQNVRLASKLTGYKIDIRSDAEKPMVVEKTEPTKKTEKTKKTKKAKKKTPPKGRSSSGRKKA